MFLGNTFQSQGPLFWGPFRSEKSNLLLFNGRFFIENREQRLQGHYNDVVTLTSHHNLSVIGTEHLCNTLTDFFFILGKERNHVYSFMFV